MTFVIGSLPQLIALLVNSFLFIFVWRNRSDRIHTVYSFFSLCVIVWTSCAFLLFYNLTDTQALFVARLLHVGIIFIPALFFHFICLLTDAKAAKKYLFLIYSTSFIFLALNFFGFLIRSVRKTNFGFYSRGDFVYRLFSISVMTIIALSLFLICRAMKGTDSLKRSRLRYLAFGTTLSLAGGLNDFFPINGIYTYPFTEIHIYPFGSLVIGIYGVCVAYSIIRYRLMDIKIIIKKTLMYSVFVVLVSIFYLFVVFMLYKIFLAQSISRFSLHFGALSVLVIALLFKPLELFLHRLLEKLFFKGTIGEISEEKEKLQTELERRERLKSVGILAAGMAHEIKNPVTVIKTFAEYLPEKYGDPDFREKFQRIVSAESERISRIVNELLAFSRPAEPRRTNVSIVALLRNVIELFSADFLKQKVRTEWGRAEDCQAFADNDQIRQVLANLIQNAIHAMADINREKVLFFEVYKDDSWIVLVIQDNGCGISQEMMAHLFDPFFSDKEGGTGLGLAISHSIIEKNGGKINVRSKEGVGTAFFISLPRSE